ARVRDMYEIVEPIKVCASSLGAPTRRKRVFFVGYDPARLAGNFDPEDFLEAMLPPTNVRVALRGLPTNVSPDWQTFEKGCRRTRALPNSEFYDRVVDHIPSGVGSEWAINSLKDNRIVTGFVGTRHTPPVLERFERLR